MALVSAVLWVLVGVLYFIYAAVKERPERAVPVLVACAAMVAGMVATVYATRFLTRIHIALGIAFAIAVICTLCVCVTKSQAKERSKIEEDLSKKKEWADSVKSTLSDEDLEKCAYQHRFTLRVSMDSRHWNYWRKEPHYSKVVQLAQIIRGTEMMKK